MRAAPLARLAAALAAALSFSPHPGDAQDRVTVHRLAARQYEVPGLVEEAVAEWLKVLALSGEDAEARQHVEALVRRQMPAWLPEEAERAAPFKREALGWEWPSGSAGFSLPPQRFLVTAVDFPAREGERWDELHEAAFPQIDYGYVWSQARRRYQARVVVHWEEASQAALAQKALRATLVWYCLAREQLSFDPTAPWGDPVDLWVTNKGEPGARAQGSSIYLYAAKIERAPGEWLRELAHEYGHVSFPGIGGFTETDDAWADGHLAELLFAKWLRAAPPEWLPWSVAEWQEGAAAERGRLTKLWSEDEVTNLIRQKTPSCPTKLIGAGEEARQAFLGLALRVEEMNGPRFLGEALKKCPRGTAAQFAEAVRRTAGRFSPAGRAGEPVEARGR
jgi:hypothetical protein